MAENLPSMTKMEMKIRRRDLNNNGTRVQATLLMPILSSITSKSRVPMEFQGGCFTSI